MAISFQFLRLSFRLQRVFWLMHCFNESAPLANIFDCMKGHNRKLNRLRERRSTMAVVLSRYKTGFSRKRIGVGASEKGGGG